MLVCILRGPSCVNGTCFDAWYVSGVCNEPGCCGIIFSSLFVCLYVGSTLLYTAPVLDGKAMLSVLCTNLCSSSGKLLCSVSFMFYVVYVCIQLHVGV